MFYLLCIYIMGQECLQECLPLESSFPVTHPSIVQLISIPHWSAWPNIAHISLYMRRLFKANCFLFHMTHTCMHVQRHTHMHAHLHTCHTYAHTHTHTNTGHTYLLHACSVKSHKINGTQTPITLTFTSTI